MPLSLRVLCYAGMKRSLMFVEYMRGMWKSVREVSLGSKVTRRFPLAVSGQTLQRPAMQVGSPIFR
jgi:hypothetical protein